MASHYSYRVDHDLGFAPHVSRTLCTVCGCKTTTIERWATPGSWVVGIGGKGTGQSDRLIYAMKVEATPTLREFRKAHPNQAAYLAGRRIAGDAPVLVSRHFFYFGDRAPRIPKQLSHIIHPTQGCRRLSDADVHLLDAGLLAGIKPGRYGQPNNRAPAPECRSRAARVALSQRG